MLSAQDISDHLNTKVTRGDQFRSSGAGAKSNDLFDPSKYGLTKVEASSSDHDKGIVKGPDGYYQIGGFERQQKEGTDTDKGKTFSSSLMDDAIALGYERPTNYNTATDIENSLAVFGSAVSEPAEDPRPEYIKKSETLAKAEAGVQAYDETYLTGGLGDAIFGPDSDKTNDKFLEKYKLALAENLKPVRADGSDRESIIQQEKEAVEGYGGDDIA